MSMPPLTLEEFDIFHTRCKQLDWYYHYSDDGAVYRAGRVRHQRLLQDAEHHPIYLELVKAYQKHNDSKITVIHRDETVQNLRLQVALRKAA
jgi:hypothetical protein